MLKPSQRLMKPKLTQNRLAGMIEDAFAFYEAVLRGRPYTLLSWPNFQLLVHRGGWGWPDKESNDHFANTDASRKSGVVIYDERDRPIDVPFSKVLVFSTSQNVAIIEEGLRKAWIEKFPAKRPPGSIWKSERELLEDFEVEKFKTSWHERREIAEDKLAKVRRKWLKPVFKGEPSISRKPIARKTIDPPYALARNPSCPFSFIAVFAQNEKHEFEIKHKGKKRESKTWKMMDAIFQKFDLALGDGDWEWIKQEEIEKALGIRHSNVKTYVSRFNKAIAGLTNTFVDGEAPKLMYGTSKPTVSGPNVWGHYYINVRILTAQEYKLLK